MAGEREKNCWVRHILRWVDLGSGLKCGFTGPLLIDANSCWSLICPPGLVDGNRLEWLRLVQ